MAISTQTDQGLIVIPSAVGNITPARSASGLATNGVISIVGEAAQGPDYTKESPTGTGVDSLEDNAYGPDEMATVVAKYGSGPIVDAFREMVQASGDADISATFGRCIIAKTNISGKASGNLLKNGGGTWAVLADRSYGEPGNLINFQVTQKVAEVKPTTGSFTYAIPNNAVEIGFRVNGGASVLYQAAAAERPPVTVVGIDALGGIDCTGGTDRGLITSVAGTLALSVVSGNQITLTISTSWATTPTAGDTMYLSATSVVKGGSNQNVGSYVITAATSTVITATKLLDGSGAVGAVTAPVAVGAISVASTTADAQAYAPVTITLTGTTLIDGIGKSLEVVELTGQTGRISSQCFQLGLTTASTFVSKSGSSTVLTSSAEYQASLAVSRSSDNLSDTIEVGGGILLQLGYTGTTATCTISAAGILTTSVAGGTGANLTVNLSKYATMNDLVAFLNTQTGYTAAVGNAPAAGSQPPLTLDPVTAQGICSAFGSKNGRIKQDGYAFWARVKQSPVQLGTTELKFTVSPVQTVGLVGLPAVTPSTFMSGGTRGSTSDATISAALLALESCTTNFVVTLVSNDATQDITDALTDSGSTYTVAGANAALKGHVIACSTLKRRKFRQGFASYRGTFEAAQAAASNMSHYRMAMTFQDARTADSTGSVVQQRPWMVACKAAAMQAGGLYRSIMRKGVNVVGALQNAGDFNDRTDSQVEKALLAGLLTIRRDESGLWYWTSDQTTYGLDNNYFLNSIQVVYAGDLIVATANRRMERALVGQSVAEVGRSVALQVLDSVMAECRALKLIAPSDDAPSGVKNITARLEGNVIKITAEVKVAGAIGFVVLGFTASAVVQG